MALALVIGLLGLLLVVLARGVELWTVACAFALIGLIVVGYKAKRGRRVLLGREVTTLVFTACLEAGIYNWEKVNEILAIHEEGGCQDRGGGEQGAEDQRREEGRRPGR